MGGRSTKVSAPDEQPKFKARLSHPAYRIVGEQCPSCDFPETEGGYCPNCEWTKFDPSCRHCQRKAR